MTACQTLAQSLSATPLATSYPTTPFSLPPPYHCEVTDLSLHSLCFPSTIKCCVDRLSWLVKKDGERVMVEKQQRVPMWWRQHPNGTYALFVRSGLKPIEFEKGKAAIPVPSLDKLPSVIDTLITAVRNGELDELLVQGTRVGMVKKSN